MAKHLFTSESVSEGHPDKIADQISDAVLDAILEQDPKARVACETYVKTGMVLVGGEITTSAWVDIEEITRNTVREIGYVHSDMGFDANSCAVLSAIGKQSPDINQGVDRADPLEQGAGDQGLMFGYATNETDVLMPAPVTYAHRLVQRQAEVRKNGTLPWLRPDAKSQVTFQYDDGKIVGIDAVVLSTQHAEDIDQKSLQEAVMEEIIKIHLKLTVPQPTRRAMWRKTSLPQVLLTVVRFRFPTLSASLNRLQSWSKPSAPKKCLLNS